MKYANLHLHSLYSDGIYTPHELCELAIQKGYRAVALTDHETTRGVEKMREAAAAFGLGFLSGIETTAHGLGVRTGGFHIVGLDIDPEHSRMRAYTEWTEKNITELSIKRFDYCLKEGYIRDITWNDVTDRFPDVGWYCNEQVFKLLQERQGVPDTDYWTFVNHFNGAPVKGMSNSKPAEEVIDIIRAAGGIAVLAHPHEQTQYLPQLAAMGLGGVEVDHPDLTEYDSAEAIRLADELGLYQSGGTDHTGVLGNSMKRGGGIVLKYMPLIPFDTDVSNGADQEAFEAIQNRVKG